MDTIPVDANAKALYFLEKSGLIFKQKLLRFTA